METTTHKEPIPLDPNVLAALPRGSKILSTSRQGTSFFTKTGRIDTQLPTDILKTYFIKLFTQEGGQNMVRGEYESMKAIRAVTPSFAPKPLGWGTYSQDPHTHFFLCDKSPSGAFGFHVDTWSGNIPQRNGWEGSWEVFFAKNMRWALECEIRVKGFDSEFETLVPVIFEKVIPRLLRPLESDGRVVKPSLVHGDLWYGNSGVDVTSNESLVFDACCLYAHNEYEFGQWRPVCNRFGPEYLTAYHRYNEISEPKEDYDGRLDLYKLRFNTHVSALFPDNEALREQMLNDMRDLVRRYG
ncbi:hypothetical protein P170DRAFT_453906 [Aspergillus steynii IBT 23096]|uniref:protein-ribulosamine 3-kinase n=1 Tax=Aspergillus steynii IBT 23096 TaxID=1392250 RepID=A0A2I2GIA8_9EURO|nr:uncharacterized protein P170DRAFT_453906 [Aspergillus steynii IBT 23096]PLB52577.1 hypothetical protein P170DRAFT_453906 [Aspergillus steynii IBT 23096]